jgi:Ca2+-binding RTX toxin-like protein
MSPTDYRAALVLAGFSDSLAAEFTSRYTILSPSLGGVGFSATLFEDRANPGQKILAVRGTNDFLDGIIADGQILLAGGPALQPQYNSLVTYYQDLVSQGQLSANEQIAVTGHSLGGFLAQLFSVHQAPVVSQTYTYNAPGIGGAVGEMLEIFEISPANVPLTHITNVISQNGFSVAAGLGTQLGSMANIFIEANRNPFHNHSIETATDALALYDLFATVNNQLDVQTVTDILHATAPTDNATLETGLDALRKLFQGGQPTVTTVGDREQYYSNLLALKNELSPDGNSLGLPVLNLKDVNVPTLTNLAQNDIAFRYALKELNPFVVLGADYTLHNESGELTLVNPETGVGELTEDYLNDRAVFLAKKIEVNSSTVATPSLTHFKDNQLGEEIGSDILPLPQVLFGDGTNEVLAGSTIISFGDRLYGGSGDDQLFGHGGQDYLEGNRGDDLLDGGNGADRMVGGTGNDTYLVDNTADTVTEAANSGVDVVQSSASFTLGANVEHLTLTGTAVSGTGNALDNVLTGNSAANILVGGGGNDVLLGGAGRDLFLYNSGDGQDLILDSSSSQGDGKGAVVFDNHLVQGGLRKAGEVAYTSSDGQFTYQLSGTDLLINGTLTIKDFTSGQLGITLVDPVATATRTTYLQEVTNPTPPPPTHLVPIFDDLNNVYLDTDGEHDLIHALGGDDVVYGGPGEDQLYGDAGNDQLIGNGMVGAVDEENDYLDGGDGNDLLQGGGGADVVLGVAGHDLLIGDATLFQGSTSEAGGGGDAKKEAVSAYERQRSMGSVSAISSRAAYPGDAGGAGLRAADCGAWGGAAARLARLNFQCDTRPAGRSAVPARH